MIPSDPGSVARFCVGLAVAAAYALVLARVGFLALTVAFVLFGVMANFPLHAQIDHWTFSVSFLGLGLVVLTTGIGLLGVTSRSPAAIAPLPRRDSSIS